MSVQLLQLGGQTLVLRLRHIVIFIGLQLVGQDAIGGTWVLVPHSFLVLVLDLEIMKVLFLLGARFLQQVILVF